MPRILQQIASYSYYLKHRQSNLVSYLVIPLFVAIIRTGAMSLSRARLRNEKHSISSIWTSSTNNTWNTNIKQNLFILYLLIYLTPGTMSAFPSSLHSATFALICSLTSPLISPVSPKNTNKIARYRYICKPYFDYLQKVLKSPEICYL